MNIYCDKCKEDISAETDIKQNTQNSVTRTYLECPNCHETYDIIYEDKISKMLQKRLRKALQGLQVEANKDKPSGAVLRMYDDERKRYAKELEYHCMHIAKKKYYGGE